jgi:hypothetical protein
MKKTIIDFENEIAIACKSKLIQYHRTEYKPEDIITYSIFLPHQFDENKIKELADYIRQNFYGIYEIKMLEHIKIIYVSFDSIINK